MRIAPNVHVLSGARRTAVYDFNHGVVWSCSDIEKRLLEWIAFGRDWQALRSEHSRDHLSGIATRMREKGWLTAGSPRVTDISFPYERARDTQNRLRHVWVELTQGCNLTCRHCYSDSSPHTKRDGEMTVQKWEEALSVLSAVPIDTITYIGGEPTLRQHDISRLCTFVSSLLPNTEQRIFSNLAIANISRKIVPLARAFGLKVGTSLYGTTAIPHDAMTGHPGSWRRTVDNIATLVGERIDVFVGFYAAGLTPEVRSAAERWLKTLGVENYRILAPSRVGRGRKTDWKAASVGNTVPDHLTFDDPSHDWFHRHNCYKDHVAISPTGSIQPCIMMRHASYGQVQELQSVNDLFENATFRKFASLSKDMIDGCSVCEFRYGCFDCRPDAMDGTANLFRKPDCGYDPRL